MSAYDDLLSRVSRPSRYLGDEVGAIRKDHREVETRVVLAHPDLYEMGMSHMGLNILYHVVNKDPRFLCERVFSPGTDYEAELRGRDLPLASLESQTPLRDFDILGISLPHELCYSNVVNLLDLARVPLRSGERTEEHPLVIAGGCAAFNPEPLAPFFDAAVIGDGEEVILRLCEVVAELRGRPRPEILEAMAEIRGVYVPAFFEPVYGEDGRLQAIRPLRAGQERVHRAVLETLPVESYPQRTVVPFQQLIHDRLSLEIMRGCTVGCRFCQAGYTYRPVRERRPEDVLRLVNASLRNTGFEEVSLLSLSSGDYCQIEPLLQTLMQHLGPEKVALSLPSLRVATLTPEIVGSIKEVRRTGFTIAPEAGSERMRRIMNKPVNDDDILRVVENVFSNGWRRIKLYFMIGLPFEEQEDLDGIIRIARASQEVMRRAGKGAVTVSVSTFVPKPHTPFQWAGQIGREQTLEKQAYLRRHLRGDGIVFKCHDAELSFVEGIFARGDRRLAPIIEAAVRLGAKFDSWSDEFRPDIWEKAFREGDLDPGEYLRARDPEEVLPWDPIHAGVETSYLREEMEAARKEAMTGDCRWDGCGECGVCSGGIQNVVHPVAGPRPPVATPRRGWDQQPWIRVRMRYRKRDRSRFLSHLEVTRVFQRAMRRAEIRVRFTQGFHPKPRMAFGPPMPVGYESDQEMLDVEIPGAPDLPALVARLNRQLPTGLRVHEAWPIGRKEPSLFSAVRTMTYRISGFLFPDDGESRIRAFLGRESERMDQVRKGKIRTVEIRSQVESMSASDDGVEIVLRARKEGGAKPAEILAHVLGLDGEARESLRVIKTACDPGPP